MKRTSTPFVEKRDGRFLCADNIRFWCMYSVVALHCIRVFTLGVPENSRAAHLFATPFKFATIGFFLVSGFLLEKNLAISSRRQLLLKRFRKLFLPWLFWAVLYVIFMALSDSAQHRTPFIAGFSLQTALSSEISRCLTSTALWFIPNMLVALTLLLLLRRYLQSLWLGAALLALNLFYTVNIYAQWIPAHHTRALLAFVFYLWLGHYAATHLAALNRLLDATSTPLLCILILSAAALSFLETRVLYHRGSIDPLNSLRASNQIFSVLMVLAFARLRRRAWPAFIDISRHTFGIYLSHALLVGIVLTSIRRLLEVPEVAPYAANPALRAGLWLAATVIAWSAGFLVSRHIAAQPRLCWMQGLSAVERPYSAQPVAEELPLFIG